MSAAEMLQLAAMPLAATLSELRGRFPLTASTLDSLKKLPGLTSLAASATLADDAVLERLSELPGLTDLNLSDLDNSPHVTAAGVKSLAKLPLKFLSLPSLKVSVNREAAESFAAMPGLVVLDLAGSDVSDDVLPALARSKTLVRLNLSETKVTDAGLKDLAGMTSLRLVAVQRVIHPALPQPPDPR